MLSTTPLDAIRFDGRFLFLSEDPGLLERQLAGEDLSRDAAGPLRSDVSTDEITPTWITYHYDEMLGEFLSEPKASVSFPAAGRAPKTWAALSLNPATRMLFDAKTIYCNGESWHVAGADAKVLRLLANQRHISRAEIEAASAQVQSLLHDWIGQGWAQLRAA